MGKSSGGEGEDPPFKKRFDLLLSKLRCFAAVPSLERERRMALCEFLLPAGRPSFEEDEEMRLYQEAVFETWFHFYAQSGERLEHGKREIERLLGELVSHRGNFFPDLESAVHDGRRSGFRAGNAEKVRRITDGRNPSRSTCTGLWKVSWKSSTRVGRTSISPTWMTAPQRDAEDPEGEGEVAAPAQGLREPGGKGETAGQAGFRPLPLPPRTGALPGMKGPSRGARRASGGEAKLRPFSARVLAFRGIFSFCTAEDACPLRYFRIKGAGKTALRQVAGYRRKAVATPSAERSRENLLGPATHTPLGVD